MNIYEKLVEVRKSVSYLKKENIGAQYKFVSSSQVLSALREEMNKLQLLLIPDIEDAKYSELLRGVSSKGNEKVELMTELFMTYKWVNAENPEESLIVKWYGQGVDTTGEKGVGKALTYSEKYFMLKFFNIPTDKDDPDFFQKKNETKKISKAETLQDENDLDILSGVDSLTTVKEITDYFNEFNSKVKNKSEFIKAINARRKQVTGS